MLEVKNLTIRAGNFQVEDVSFFVERGSCHILLGPTGSGKSLILETIAGLRHSEYGSIHLSGHEVTKTFPEKRNISYLPQDLAIFPNMTVKDNISYSLRIKGLSKEERYNKIMPLAQTLGIDNLLNRSTRHLSGGEKQRVALARALITGNKIVLLDEPLSSLNVSLRREIWQLLKEIQKKHELTYLVVTHDLDEALFLGDKISVISDGKIIQTGHKKMVYNFPRSIEAAKILGVENFFGAVVKKSVNNHIVLYCKEIETTLNIKRSNYDSRTLKENALITIGIRANNLRIMKPKNDSYITEKDNAAQFIIETMYEKGSIVVMLLKHLNCSLKAIAEVPNLDKNLSYSSSQRVSVSFPGENIILFG